MVKFIFIRLKYYNTLKILFKYEWFPSTGTIYSDLNLKGLKEILTVEQCNLVYKIINNLQKCNINIMFYDNVHNYQTTSHNTQTSINSIQQLI